MVRELQPGDPQAMGPYRLAGRLGQGGMGQVFLGVSPGGRPVAVKAIRAELASDPQFRSRFAREVAAARRVNGLFTATVVDADVDGPVPWLATAYVPGPSLAEAMAGYGPLPEASLLSLAAGLAESLNAIHVSGVVHRDLKPSNVLLAEDGPRVIDFGISHAVESSALTQVGLVVGSPGFMSPEQATGGEVGPATDIFSLGAVLAFAATGLGPFGTGTTASLLYRVVHETPNLDQVPARLRPLVERCLAKDPAQRPVAAGVVAEVGALHSGGDWLPDSIIRMFAQTPEPVAPLARGLPEAAGLPEALATTPAADLVAATAPVADLVPAPRPADVPTVPDGFILTPPDQATGLADGYAGRSADGPPPPSATTSPSRGRWERPLVLGTLAVVLALITGAGVFGLAASTGHAPSPVRSHPAAQTSPATSVPGTSPGGSSPAAAHPRATSPESTPQGGGATQPVVGAFSSTHASASPTAPASRSASGSPTSSTSATTTAPSTGSPTTSASAPSTGSPSTSASAPASASSSASAPASASSSTTPSGSP